MSEPRYRDPNDPLTTAAGRDLLGALTHFSMRLGPDRYHADPKAATEMILAIEAQAAAPLHAALSWALDELDLCVTRLRENHGYVLETYEAGRAAALAALAAPAADGLEHECSANEQCRRYASDQVDEALAGDDW